jgi:hypothetical protein
MRLWYRHSNGEKYKFINIAKKDIGDVIELQNPQGIETNIRMYRLNTGLKKYPKEEFKVPERITKTKKDDNYTFYIVGKEEDFVLASSDPVSKVIMDSFQNRYSLQHIETFFNESLKDKEKIKLAIEEKSKPKETKPKIQKEEFFHVFAEYENNKKTIYKRKVLLEPVYILEKEGYSHLYSPDDVQPHKRRKKNVIHFYCLQEVEGQKYVTDIPYFDEYLNGEDWKKHMTIEERAKEQKFELSSNSLKVFEESIKDSVLTT